MEQEQEQAERERSSTNDERQHVEVEQGVELEHRALVDLEIEPEIIENLKSWRGVSWWD